jgi:hypothetical protein
LAHQAKAMWSASNDQPAEKRAYDCPAHQLGQASRHHQGSPRPRARLLTGTGVREAGGRTPPVLAHQQCREPCEVTEEIRSWAETNNYQRLPASAALLPKEDVRLSPSITRSTARTRSRGQTPYRLISVTARKPVPNRNTFWPLPWRTNFVIFRRRLREMSEVVCTPSLPQPWRDRWFCGENRRRRAVAFFYRPAGRWSEWIATGLGNACFFVGKLLDFDPRVSEPREEKHEGGQQEEGGGRPERRIGTRDGGYDAA